MRRLFEGGVYSRAAFIRGRRLLVLLLPSAASNRINTVIAEFFQYQYSFDLVAGLLKSGNKKTFAHFVHEIEIK